MKSMGMRLFIPGIRIDISKAIYGSDNQFIPSDEMEVFMVISGEMVIRDGNEIYQCPEGTIVFLNNQSRFICRKKITLIRIEFGATGFSKHKSINIFTPQSPDYKEICDMFKGVASEFEHKNAGYEMRLKGICYFILSFIERYGLASIRDTGVSEKAKIRAVLEYVEDHHGGNITLEDASELAKLSKQYFCKVFRENTGTTFIKYVNKSRVAKAEELLLQTDKKITEIALETGFSTIQYFNRIFKKEKDLTPSEYRKKYL